MGYPIFFPRVCLLSAGRMLAVFPSELDGHVTSPVLC